MPYNIEFEGERYLVWVYQVFFFEAFKYVRC